METRASYLLIGSFVIVAVVALLGFVLWLAKVDIDKEFAFYHIVFDEAVTGLTVGGPVRYNGIPVGTVTTIEIDPHDPAKVRVLARIDAQTPIRADTIAKLELQGITGIAFVQLSGGTTGAEILRPGPDGEPAVIRSQRSAFAELFAGAPDLINRAAMLVSDVNELVSPANRQAVANILTHFEDLSGRFADRGPEIEQLVVNLTEASAKLGEATDQINTVMRSAGRMIESAEATMSVARGTLVTADDVIDNEARQALQDIAVAGAQFEKVGRELETLIADNREGLTAFTEDGLVEFTRFLEEARLLVAASTRLIEDLNKDPRQFLFGGQEGGFEAQ